MRYKKITNAELSARLVKKDWQTFSEIDKRYWPLLSNHDFSVTRRESNLPYQYFDGDFSRGLKLPELL